MNGKNCIERLSPVLLWDIDPEKADMDTCPQQIIVRVLEYGTLEDWRLIRSYYGLDKIVETSSEDGNPVIIEYKIKAL